MGAAEASKFFNLQHGFVDSGQWKGGSDGREVKRRLAIIEMFSLPFPAGAAKRMLNRYCELEN